MKKQRIKAFTLIELMVVIALIGIIALGASNINFNNLSDKQRLDGFFYEIKTNIETVKNNALIGKAIKLSDNRIIVPNKWEIQLNNSSSGIIQTYYYEGTTQYPYNQNNIITDNFYSILSSCEKLDNSDSDELTDTGSLFIEGGKISFIGNPSDCDSTQKILRIKSSYKSFDKVFTINTISGIIEEE